MVGVGGHHLRDLVVEHLAEAERADYEAYAERDGHDRHDETAEMASRITQTDTDHDWAPSVEVVVSASSSSANTSRISA